MRLLLLVVLAGCATVTTQHVAGSPPLKGPREITAISGREWEVRHLSEALAQHGFRLRAQGVLRPDQITTPYALDFSGSCSVSDVKVMLIDKATDQIVFTATQAQTLVGCPGTLYEDFAAGLDSAWEKSAHWYENIDPK